MTPEQARAEFDASLTYLNTATLGLPPRRSLEALETAQAHWRAGTTDAVAFDAVVERARTAFAALVGVHPDLVAVGHQVSPLVGLVASWLPDGAEVLVAAGDFTSVTFPFAAQAGRGVRVREVPLEHLAQEVTAGTSLVAVSAVQSADGRVAPLADLVSACAEVGARTLLDLTQATGWLPVAADDFDVTVCSSYKWLLGPRGGAFLTLQPDLVDELVPTAAGWYAGADRWSSIYGLPLRLASNARRFDVSPAWHTWVGSAPALELLAEVGVDALHRHAVGLADRFLDGVGLPRTGSAILSLAVDEDTARTLVDARIAAATRAGRLRLSFHLSTGPDDVDHAIAALRPHLVSP